MNCSIVIASYGERYWLDLACERATRSAMAQDVPVIYVHGLTLHGSRNAGLAQVETEFVVFLDADDELEDGYIEAMMQGSCDVRAPAVRYVIGQRARAPYVPRVAGHRHDCSATCLEHGNFIVVGAMVRTHLVRSVGGWESFPWSEDWALWARCWRAGATIEMIPNAIYRAHVRSDSRNRGVTQEVKNAAHWEIHRAVWPELYETTA